MTVQNFDVPIYGPSKNVSQDDPEYTMNMYPEKVSDEVYTLKRRAGHNVIGQFGVAGGGRGQIVVGGRHFGIRGSFFCEFVNGASVTLGILASQDGNCGLIANLPPGGNGQILIVGPGEKEGYVFQIQSNVFTTLTEADNGFVGGGGQCVFFGGRGWVIKVGTGQFQCCLPYDFLTWPGDAFGTAEFGSDNLLALETNGNYLLLLGKYTGEVWVFQNTLPLPVQPTNSTFSIGILAPGAHINFENDFYWFGGNAEGKGVVYTLSAGGEPLIISDYSVIRNIAPLLNQSDAYMYAYQDLGHRFIYLTFITGNRTFVYDLSEGLWHEESTRLVPSGFVNALPWESVVFNEGKLLGLNRLNGQIAEIKDTIYTDNGNPIVLDRKLSVFPKEASWKSFYRSVELFCEMGNTAPPTESTYTNVVTGTSLAFSPIIYNELARYIHIGYYVGSDTFVAFAFSSAAARSSYLQGGAVDGFLGVATGPIQDAGQTVTIKDGAGANLVLFQMQVNNVSELPFDFDVLKEIVQPDNNPSIMLRVSRDRGMTYGTEMWRQMSGNGSYVCRPVWTGLGAAFGLTLWFRFVANQYVSFRGVRIYAENNT
jgi:hypothetical protein